MINVDKNEIVKNWVHFGTLKRKWNPKMNNYIFGKSGRNYMLDIEKIISSCQGIKEYLRETVRNGGNVLFLSTKQQSKNIIKEEAEKCEMPYINNWKGGFFTNFREIKGKLKELQILENIINKPNFSQTQKKRKNQLFLIRKRDKLKKSYEGVSGLKKLPEVIFIAGLSKENIAYSESLKTKVPIIAICNSNCDPRLVDYVIPGNDDNVKSITFLVNFVSNCIREIKEEKELETKENN